MPLSFETRSHGSIAFGFFNIESDMLLLEKYFFFADRFCRWISAMAEDDTVRATPFVYKVYHISKAQDIGDLMGAIHGIRFAGFIGRIYQLFPFPDAPKNFKQNPEGDKTQDLVKQEISAFADIRELSISFVGENQVSTGPYQFDKQVFHELIRYVWEGGYPQWKDGVRPAYVLQMKEDLQQSRHPFFTQIF